VFDRHPKLQVVIGHLGEGPPFMLPRLDRNMSTQLTELQRPLGAYLRENVHYTFAGLALSAISALASRRWCLACGSPGRC
jgi:predicted TIM-barrel fold metal-dependent hydrolase